MSGAANDGLRALVSPRSIAVIGASSDADRYPGKVLINLKRYGFAGPVYGVNPKRTEVLGFPCYPDIAAVPEAVDVALIILAARSAPSALDAAIRAGARSAIVFASGMAEVGGEGLALQDEVRRLAREGGIRVLGPNTLGFINVLDGITLSGAAALQGGKLVGGPIGVAASSGGLMGSILDRGWVDGLGFSYAFSTGNEADITLADCVEFMARDERTSAIALFAEAIRDVNHFRRACELATDAGKPVVVLKVGRSARGRVTAATHTGALAGSSRAFDALFERLGVISVGDLDELFTVPGILVRSPLPKGPRLAVACVSGGMAELSADKAEAYGIQLADFTAETTRKISELQAGFGQANNPLDITGQVVSKETWWMIEHIETLAIEDPNVDVMVLGLPTSQSATQSAEDIVRIATASRKPVITLWAGHRAIADALARLRGAGVPVFEQADLCYRSIAAVFRYAAFREKRARAGLIPTDVPDDARVSAAMSLLRCGRSLTEHESKKLLSLYGIRISDEKIAMTREEAVAAARAIGFPVAIKGHGVGLLHKTEHGAVRLGLSNPEQVALAFDEVTGKASVHEVLVAKMADPGLEVLVGLARDPDVGLLLAVGMGGTLAEVLDDVAFAMPPLVAGEATELVGRLRGARLLEGVRGGRPLDRVGLEQAITGLSRLAIEVGDEIEQLDVNPLIVSAVTTTAVDALVVPRQLVA